MLLACRATIVLAVASVASSCATRPIGLLSPSQAAHGPSVSTAVQAAPVSPSAGSRGRLFGVFDESSGHAIAGARVQDRITGTFALTSETGTVGLSFVKANGSYIEIRKAGYTSLTLIVDPADTTPITVVLKPLLARELQSIANGFSGFEDRCQQRGVFCLREQDLAQPSTSRLSDFIVRAPGVDRRCPTSVASCSVSMRGSRGPGECAPDFVVDGHFFQLPQDVLSELEHFLIPRAVKGIEVYTSPQQIPREIDRATGCGVIVIWKR
jgi:hypothetical protein